MDEKMALLRAPFPAHQISQLPKPTRKREELEKLPKAKCSVCGGYHAVQGFTHLSYVGHAATTNRLLDVDAQWNWEPLAFDDRGLPRFDDHGGLWIRLTVCGITRLGYGNAEPKSFADVGAREKECIGDAIRNAAMRFGVALGLWHKGELILEAEPEPETPKPAEPEAPMIPLDASLIKRFGTCQTMEELQSIWAELPFEIRRDYREVKDSAKSRIANAILDLGVAYG